MMHCGRIPTRALLIDTIIAVVLFGLSIYHFTQPDQAWRSGMIELFSVILLITAAFFVSCMKSTVIYLIDAPASIVLGIYHLTHGGGWRSGITDLLFAVLLMANAYIIIRADGEKEHS